MIRHEQPSKLDIFADSPFPLSGFRGQVKKPEISGLEPLRRSHLKSLRLTGYETCRWPDGSNSLGLDCLRLWKKGNAISLNSSRRNQRFLTYLFPFSNFWGQVKKVPRTVALSGFRGQVKKPDCSGLDLCVVAISSLYALQAMRLVGGLTAQTVWG